MKKTYSQNKYVAGSEMYDKMRWIKDNVSRKPAGVAQAFEKASNKLIFLA